MLMRTGQNDEALQKFKELEMSNIDFIPFFYLDYLKAECYLRKLESHPANRHLDLFLDNIEPKISTKNVALWIDVEGAGYDVLEGIHDIASRTLFIQVEVETEEIWQGQKLKKDVLKLADQLGFIELGRGKHDLQHDLILINQSYFLQNKLKCMSLTRLAVFFYYVRKWGGHILSNLLLVPILGIRRHD
jgi:hypothetical protein